jgi:hypothetical protein
MRTIAITFKEFRQEPTDPPGVRIYSHWGDKDEATERENRYADEAACLIDAILKSLHSGECVAISSDKDPEVAEKKIDDQLKVRRAARHGQSPN